ncbi:MAG: family IA [Candidatus Tokpelaia sp. JSC189]|nr:MAG: family IA [Candidatus Tokpelaia sp. JSC189]
MSKSEFVIFDCDGVLVDSEYLSNQINAELLTKSGYTITAEKLAERYAGLVLTDTLKAIEQETDIPISANLIKLSEDLFIERIKTDLIPIDGVRQSIERLHLPYCVCSNSASANIRTMLTLTGLYDLFEKCIFSAPEVGTMRSKPAPDVFLYAAKQYQVSPANVIVLEDSVHGATAAKNAGMRVVGFTGGSHAWLGLADALMKAGAETTISQHIDLPAVIETMEHWTE